MHYCRIGVAILLVAILSACGTSRPRYGATDFSRISDTNGVPTYSAHGNLGFREEAEIEIDKMMMRACPNGDPQIISGYKRTGQSVPRSWSVTFTCNDVIPLD